MVAEIFLMRIIKYERKAMKGINIGIEIGLIVEVFGMLTMV